MIAHAALAMVVLSTPGALPAVALGGLRPSTVFLVPLAGAAVAAGAATVELVVPGSFLLWFVVVGVVATAAAAPRALPTVAGSIRRRDATGPVAVSSALWPIVTVLVMAGAVAWPLQVLRIPMIGYDGYAIWTSHAMLVYGGHHTLLAGLSDPHYYQATDYPPLVPAAGALSFVTGGGVDLRLAVDMTALLNAAALGALGCGLAGLVAARGGAAHRMLGIVAGAAICLVGFGLGGSYAVNGYADLLWSAAGSGAVVFGLLSARSPTNLGATAILVVVAGLSKNEGFVTAIMVTVIVVLRYVPLRRVVARFPFSDADDPGLVVAALGRSTARAWLRRAVLGVAMVAPGALWAATAKSEGIDSVLLSSTSTQNVGQRLGPTVSALAHNLHVLPAAAAVAVAGAVLLRPQRTRLGMGCDAWLWLVVAGSIAALVTTYVLGAFEIHWWLSNSITRTTIFAQLALYTDLATWMLVATTAGPPGAHAVGRNPARPSSLSSSPGPHDGETGAAERTPERAGLAGVR
jgi:hypothetical protein